MLTAGLNTARRLGCEFEMAVPLNGKGDGKDVQDKLARILTANGLRAISRPYSNKKLKDGIDLAIENDCSIHGESHYTSMTYVPIEAKTRILNGMDDLEKIVPDTLNICREIGATVNKTCGFHVHIELKEVKRKPSIIRSLFNLFHRFEPVIYGFVDPNRSDNDNACPIPASWSGMLQKCCSVRNHFAALVDWPCASGLNLTHLFRGSTFSKEPRIEIRYHQGTLSPEEVRHWVRFCLRLIDHACNRSSHAYSSQAQNDRQELENLFKTCGFKVNNKIYSKVCPELQDTRKYLIRRWKHYNGKIALKASKRSSG